MGLYLVKIFFQRARIRKPYLPFGVLLSFEPDTIEKEILSLNMGITYNNLFLSKKQIFI